MVYSHLTQMNFGDWENRVCENIEGLVRIPSMQYLEGENVRT